MTDDPEITDPRDPYKRRDIVAELDGWIAAVPPGKHATVTLQGARDEIVALREKVFIFAASNEESARSRYPHWPR